MHYHYNFGNQVKDNVNRLLVDQYLVKHKLNEELIKHQLKLKLIPLESGRLFCKIFPANHAPKIKKKPIDNSIFEDLEGFFKISIQGISPFLLNVKRYHETYKKDIPINPTIPKEKELEFQGPEKENFG